MAIERIVIIGAGAIGAGTAAELALAQLPGLLIGRGEQIRVIAEQGLRYRTAEGTQSIRLDTAEGIGAAALRSTDLILLATKAQHIEQVSAELAYRRLTDDPERSACTLPVLAIQNGLAAEEILQRRFARIYSGSVLIPARYTEIGTVISGAAPKRAHLMLGRYGAQQDPLVEETAQWLRQIRWIVQTTENILAWKALKLLHNVKNGIEVLTGTSEQLRELEQAVVTEARAVFAAESLVVADPQHRELEPELMRVDPGSGYRSNEQSTWQSFQRGADSEVDYLNGEIVLRGRRHQVPTPANEALQRVLGQAVIDTAAAGSVSAAQVLGLMTELTQK